MAARLAVDPCPATDEIVWHRVGDPSPEGPDQVYAKVTLMPGKRGGAVVAVHVRPPGLKAVCVDLLSMSKKKALRLARSSVLPYWVEDLTSP